MATPLPETPLVIGDIQYSSDRNSMYVDVIVDGHKVRVSGDVAAWNVSPEKFQEKASLIVAADRVAIKKLNGRALLVDTATWKTSLEKIPFFFWQSPSYTEVKIVKLGSSSLESTKSSTEMTELELAQFRIEQALKKQLGR